MDKYKNRNSWVHLTNNVNDKKTVDRHQVVHDLGEINAHLFSIEKGFEDNERQIPNLEC